ncbi:MAG: FtsX-like permease family protein [Candidatus Lokiarchaeota archaeon]|nr:FtsX-like permease family protein [Candidatus Lokiarchaeota archaeon]
MPSFDFALKDFYRKRHSNYPFLIIIIIIIAFTEFLIYFTSSLGINILTQATYQNKFYFSGGINLIYKEFNNLIQILFICLVFVIVVAVTTTLIISKKKDIAIMKSLGTLPRKLYSFYLFEAYILFFIGFIFGLVLGLIIFGIFALFMKFFNFPVVIVIDLVYTPILFFSCILGIFLITGYTLRKIGKQKIINSFSKDIPFNYNAGKQLTFIPKWLTSIGFNIKIAIVNTLRKTGEFKRYLIIFSIIGLMIFTLGLGAIVLRLSSQEWIKNSQSENIVIIGHEDVIYNYSLMYKMFSDPTLLIEENSIDFIDSQYLFNLSDLVDLNNIEEIEIIDERLINFYKVEELTGIHINEDDTYTIVGQNRNNTIPIIGVNPENIIQNFEIEGRFFTKEDAYDNITIGDGLAYNFFEYALDQSIELTSSGNIFHISGVVIDSFYSGWAAYISIEESRKILNLKDGEINIVMLKLSSDAYNGIKITLENISKSIGENFTHLRLDETFQDNIDYLSYLSIYPILSIFIISIIAIFSLYNYQKAGLMEKAKDFLIMRAIGSKTRSLKKILFLESLFVLIPSLLLSLAFGMIINSLFLFNRVYLPPLYIPFILFLFLFGVFIFFNFLSLFPLIKKINNFSVNDFNIY